MPRDFGALVKEDFLYKKHATEVGDCDARVNGIRGEVAKQISEPRNAGKCRQVIGMGDLFDR